MRGFLIILAVLAILAGVFFVFTVSNSQGGAPTEILPGNSNINKENSPESPESIGAQIHSIEIKGFAFQPSELRIRVGDTVIWTNKDFDGHTITSDSGNELDSSLISRNQEYSHTFNDEGTFNYHCTPHPYMKGKIIVE